MPNDELCLRPVGPADVDELHALLSLPASCRYLSDGNAPPRNLVEDWVDLADAHADVNGVGLWVLEDDGGRVQGCVRLEPTSVPEISELTYVVHPSAWGAGLATRMAAAAVDAAFRHGRTRSILAGADLPNTASVAVMGRLGMTYHRHVDYPAGPGVEHILHRNRWEAAADA